MIKSVAACLLSLAFTSIGISAQSSKPILPAFHMIAPQFITDDGIQPSQELERFVNQTRETYQQLFGDYVQWSDQGTPSIQVKAISTKSSDLVTVEFTNDTTNKTKAILHSWKSISPKALANAIFYLVAFLAKADTAPIGNDPVLVDIMDVRDLIPRDVISYGAMPYSIASKSNGNLVIGQNSIITEIDNNGRLIDHYGRTLLAQNQYSFAYDLRVSPSGTIYSRPASGQDLFIFTNSQENPRKSSSSIEQAASFAVLADGSYVVKDAMSARTVLVDHGRRTELDLTTSQQYQYFLLAGGPDSTIWVYDFVSGEVRSYAKDGTLLDQVIPLQPENSSSGVKQLLPYPDGSFVLWSNDSIRRFDRRGFPIWSADRSTHSEIADNNLAFSVSFDPVSGCLFYTKPMSKQIYRVLDKAWCRQNKIDWERFQPLIAANRLLLDNNNDTNALKTRADWYFDHKAFDIAGTLYGLIAEQDPTDLPSADRVHRIKVRQLEESADTARRRVLETIKNIGPETARLTYQLTLQLFEQLLALDQNNEKARTARNELIQTMKNAEHGSDDTPSPVPEMNIVQFGPFFPALIATYQNQTNGVIRIRNSLNEPITGLSISVLIPRFMDFPAETTANQILQPGDSLEIPIRAPINQEALQIEEDFPIQAQISLKWTAKAQNGNLQKTISSIIYRRTALIWDNSAKLASFITPNEETVSGFALRSLNLVEDQAGKQADLSHFSPKIRRSAAIIDALASYHIAYLEDPQSPFSKVLGKTAIIDTVRFPRTTLFYKNGDCDDTFALLASLLEAAGVHTAIMTTPGHVFIAFDTEEPAENVWIFNQTAEVLVKDSTIWIPIETTDLDQGFLAAWKKASELLKNNKSTNTVEFLVLADQRNFFPAIPLSTSPYEILLPSATTLNSLLNSDCLELTAELSEKAIAKFNQLLPKQGRGRITMLNQIGILYSRFGKQLVAEDFFNQAIRDDSKNLAAYVNLGNLFLESGEFNRALAIINQAQKIRPESPMISLLLSQTWLALGDKEKSQTYFAQLRQKSPELADQFAYLVSGKERQSTDRADRNNGSIKTHWLLNDQ